MTAVRLSTAAALCGKSRQTVYRLAKTGVLSVSTGPDGTLMVTPEELHRVFGDHAESLAERRDVPVGRLRETIAALRARVGALEEQLEEARAREGRLLSLVELATRGAPGHDSTR